MNTNGSLRETDSMGRQSRRIRRYVQVNMVHFRGHDKAKVGVLQAKERKHP